NGRVGGCDVFRQLQDFDESLRLADRTSDGGACALAPANFLLELLVLHPHCAELAGPAQDRDQLVVREGFLDVVERARVDGGDSALERCLRRHQDDRRHRILLPRCLEDVEPRDLRHPNVRQDDVVTAAPNLLQSGLAALCRGDLESLVAQQDAERIEYSGLVVNYEHRRLLTHASSSGVHSAGIRTVKAVPAPGLESTNTSPRCASTARCTIASPRPLPPGRPDTNGSKTRSLISSGIPGPSSRISSRTARSKWPWGRSAPPSASPTDTVTCTLVPLAACTALSTRFPITRWSRSPSPSSTVRGPCTSRTASTGQSGCSLTNRVTASATSRRSTGTNSVARTREKSRNSLSSRLSRSLSRTMRSAR